MTTITVSEAIQLIMARVRGTIAISIDAVTPPDLLKKDRQTREPARFKTGQILKDCRMDGMIGFDYGNSVNNQADREGLEHREAKDRKWGELTPDRIFATYKGKFYLQMKVQSYGAATYTDANGNELSLEAMGDILPLPSEPSSTQADLTKPVVVRDVTMTNVKGMRFCGKEYAIVANEDAADMSVDQVRKRIAEAPTTEQTEVVAEVTEDTAALLG
jgi:hypothetical protein